jgi:hypothetical protein
MFNILKRKAVCDSMILYQVMFESYRNNLSEICALRILTSLIKFTHRYITNYRNIIQIKTFVVEVHRSLDSGKINSSRLGDLCL